MRPGEAVRLADVDPDEAMITIRDAKYGKSRRIPVDATVTAAPGIPGKAPALFLSAYGTRIVTRQANAEFRRITAATGIGANAVSPPRIHHLRLPETSSRPTAARVFAT